MLFTGCKSKTTGQGTTGKKNVAGKKNAVTPNKRPENTAKFPHPNSPDFLDMCIKDDDFVRYLEGFKNKAVEEQFRKFYSGNGVLKSSVLEFSRRYKILPTITTNVV